MLPSAPVRSPGGRAGSPRAGRAVPAGSRPATGWRSRQSRPTAAGGHMVRRKGPAHPPCGPRSRRLSLGDAPLPLLPRLEDVFFRCRRTVSWDMRTPARQLHQALPANRRRVQWSPWGRWAAGQGNQMGFAPVIQLPVPVGLGPVPQLLPDRPRQSLLIRYTVP